MTWEAVFAWTVDAVSAVCGDRVRAGLADAVTAAGDAHPLRTPFLSRPRGPQQTRAPDGSMCPWRLSGGVGCWAGWVLR